MDLVLRPPVRAPPRRGQPPWPGEPTDPPRGGRLLTLDEVIAETVREYGIRNRTYIRWADEPSEADAPPNVVPDAVIEEEEQEDGND